MDIIKIIGLTAAVGLVSFAAYSIIEDRNEKRAYETAESIKRSVREAFQREAATVTQSRI